MIRYLILVLISFGNPPNNKKLFKIWKYSEIKRQKLNKLFIAYYTKNDER